MESFVDFITRLIYATGGEAVVTPNHSNWLSLNPSPNGLDWIDHYLDRLLPAYETWLSTNNLPPIVAWNGEDTRPWDAGLELPLGSPLDDPMAIGSLSALGAAFRDRYDDIASAGNGARELTGLTKAPFSYRFWGLLKFFDNIRRWYQGEIVIPATVMYDRDGTILTPIAFCNTFNTLHGNWHGVNNDTGVNSQPTPGFESSAGQTTRRGGLGMGSGEEFIKFHHEHTELFSRWLARTGQLPVKPINMYNGASGWPGSNTGNPSTWVENLENTWINDSTGDTDNELLALTDVNAIGSNVGGVHGTGHTSNSDIGSINHNNFVSRFHAWHGWIDSQWYWRKPRFGFYDNATKQRVRVFHPVLFSTGNSWPGMKVVTVVRDPLVVNDAIAPVDGVNGIDFVAGSGSIRMQFRIEDPYNRQLEMRLSAEVFDDSTATVVETVSAAIHTYTVGTVSSGDDFDLNSDFTIDFNFTSAFQSDDPGRSNPEVGFVNSRIRIYGELEVADGSDPGFIESDFLDIELVQEKEAPEIDLYFDLSSFGVDQVNAAQSLSGTGDGVFANALYVVLQDRTTDANPIDWLAHPAVLPEVRGLIEGFTPASGLFDDSLHAPEVVIWDPNTGAPVVGVRAELASGPILEDPTLADNLPQRFTYAYDIIFETPNDAFTGLPLGGQRNVEVRVRAADRSGNQAAETGQLTFLNQANPFMRDGDTSWLSIDTRVFHILENDTLFGETMTDTRNPNEFIQTVLGKLNTGSGLGGDTFDGLPTNQASSALLPFPNITDQTTGTSRVVHNFALAKVRLQGLAGAANVRAFFRLFRYSAPNLVFDPNTHYRFHDTGGGTKIPLLGFTGTSGGDELVSVPFFAEPRVPTSAAMTTQTDPTNVMTFPTGIATEQEMYFGVYLDINQSAVRFPIEYVAAHPDGGFTVSDPTQSLPTLMLDRHQCMVVEIKYDGDPTPLGARPSNSDNLAQRNLMILTTDNPGALLTHTVQHSFEVDLGKRLAFHGDFPDNEQGPDGFFLQNGPERPINFLSKARLDVLSRELAINIAMNTPEVSMKEWPAFLERAERELRATNAKVFDNARWVNTKNDLDELMIIWNDLPANAKAEVYFPGINCETIINLRNIRHAPGDVKIVDSHTLTMRPQGITYLPMPPVRGSKLAAVITIELPEDVKKGQNWQVDVVQLRGGQRQILGGFQIDIQVKTAPEIAWEEALFLKHAFHQLSLLPATHRWRPVMARRVETIRARSKALAEAAGVEWTDPTVYELPGQAGVFEPLEGQLIRVILEKIQVLDDLDTFIKGKGELQFHTRVYTSNNGGLLQEKQIPETGVIKVSDKPGKNIIPLQKVLFEGFVKDDLAIEIVGRELDLIDKDDVLGKYTRIFCEDLTSVFGGYQPGRDEFNPEDLLSWRIWYRIERG